MKNYFVKILSASLLSAVLLCGCGEEKTQEDIIVLYTNDVHCAVDEEIGYSGLAAYKQRMEEKTPYVTLADCGDAIRGDVIGMVSEGEYPVQIMNKTGYDFAVPGNHEFGYGMEQFEKLLQESESQYLGCNIEYTGTGKSALESVKPYSIVSYGETKVAYIGVCTPESITDSIPAYFTDESGEFVYDFCGGADGKALYGKVQNTVDECRDKGADYVILLAHLGVNDDSEPFRSVDLIENTKDVDAVLDGHSHSTIPCRILKNKNGDEVILSSTGTKLENIGQLIITPDGNLMTGLVSDYPERDEDMDSYIEEIKASFEEDMKQVVAHSDIPLSINDENGTRIVRSRETNIGDFCADAYRMVSGADIAFVNGGGIRSDFPSGDITLKDMVTVHPYGNTLCTVEASGQEILDALELANRAVAKEVSDGKNAVGENGGFLQVSGITFKVDTQVASSVKMDDNGMFVSCGNERRVKEVKVLKDDGSYEPINPDKMYTVASHDYLLRQGGDGFAMFMDKPLLTDEGILDYQVLLTYITDYLGGTVGSEYSAAQGRILVE